MTTRRTAPNDKALDAFIAAKAEIDIMLERLKALSDDHFEFDPDAITAREPPRPRTGLASVEDAHTARSQPRRPR